MESIEKTTDTSLSADRVEPVIAGTLALMSQYPRRPCCRIAEQISVNLSLLSRCTYLSPPLRLLCTNLGREWDGMLVEQYHAIIESQGGEHALH